MSLDNTNSEDEIPTLVETVTSAEQNVEQHTDKKIPCTLISGFLGAGKSTLLKHILTTKHDQRIAVIMNEFGDTADIEAKAINVRYENDESGQLREAYLELPNGCLCCSVKDLGIASIENFMRRNGAFDHILLETTGLADPGPIASLFWQNEDFSEGLGNRMFLNGVIVVVDAVFGQKQLEEEGLESRAGESSRQIACADLVLLNKVDLVEDSSVAAVENIVRLINPTAALHRTIRGEVQPDIILGLNAYSSAPKLINDNSSTLMHGHEDEHDEAKHTHYSLLQRSGITSLKIDIPVIQPGQANRFDEWLRSVLWENHLPERPDEKIEVLRCKGLYRTNEGSYFMLQGVRNLYEINRLSDEESKGLGEVGKFVLIGKGLSDQTRSNFYEFMDFSEIE